MLAEIGHFEWKMLIYDEWHHNKKNLIKRNFAILFLLIHSV